MPLGSSYVSLIRVFSFLMRPGSSPDAGRGIIMYTAPSRINRNVRVEGVLCNAQSESELNPGSESIVTGSAKHQGRVIAL